MAHNNKPDREKYSVVSKVLSILMVLMLTVTNLNGNILLRTHAENSGQTEQENDEITIDGVPVVKELREIISEAKTEEENYDEEDNGEESRFDDDVEFETGYKVTSTWKNHCNAEVTIKNTNEDKVDNWEVAFTYVGEIENIWNGQIISHEKDVYVVKNVKWNQDIAAGESVTFGFTAKYEGSMPEEPTDFDIQKMEEEVVEDDYSYTYTQFTRWGNHIQGQVELTNTSEEYIEDWQFLFDTNMQIKNIWNAEVEEEDENYLSFYEEVENEEDDKLVGYTYCLGNMGYNQNIAPGETINFGFIAECLDEKEGFLEEPELTRLTVSPEDEEEPEYDPDEEEEMEVVDGLEMDGDDYDLMQEYEDDEEDEEEVQQDSVSAQSLVNSQGILPFGTAQTSLSKTNSKKCASDQLPYNVADLPHHLQVQAWCMYKDGTSGNRILFVAQCSKSGDAIISLCEPDGTNANLFKYKSEIQVVGAGHVQTICCYCKKSKTDTGDDNTDYERYYIMLNAHGVKYKMKGSSDIVWPTRIARMAYNAKRKKVDDSKLKVKYENGTTNGNCIKVIGSSKLRQFTALAYANKNQKAFAGMAKDGKAELKRVEFAVSPDKKYLAVMKRSGKRSGKKTKMEYSLYNFKKVLAVLENKKSSQKALSFSKGKMKKYCYCSNLENCKGNKKTDNILEYRTSIQGMAVDKKGNIYITSGDDKLCAKKSFKNIGIFKKDKANKGYNKQIVFHDLELDIDKDLWVRDFIAEKIKTFKGIDVKVPYPEIEGAQIVDGKIVYVVGAKKKKYKINDKEKWNLRSHAFIFSRSLSDLK